MAEKLNLTEQERELLSSKMTAEEKDSAIAFAKNLLEGKGLTDTTVSDILELKKSFGYLREWFRPDPNSYGKLLQREELPNFEKDYSSFRKLVYQNLFKTSDKTVKEC